ncbi:unnamed protein product [Cuscuta epithymum]|uniref:HAT C-terminal dimerisation domain-containing protein n=1 Tax=Cuscuta epithymum TaxID=186058 RepID=A0AAV0CDL6_9ASTE|nr:unnamed protein product [Cuscuta epithymum]
MRGEWSGLQALISNECPYAYYIHCFAHRLQLALVAAAKEVIPIHHFFEKVNTITNVVTASCKRHDQLQAAQAEEIARLIRIEELETGRGLNQVGTLKRASETRWSSHLSSLRSLKIMYVATCSVLKNIISDGTTYAQRADADAVYDGITSFEFILILHIMIDILEISYDLCQALQCKSQDIVNAMHLVSTTKTLIQKLREDGWDLLFGKVKLFCEKMSIDIPNMTDHYTAGRGRSRRIKGPNTMAHHFQYDIFIATVDSQLQELNERFTANMMELLVLCSALDPRDDYKYFSIENVCKLDEKYYPDDFSEQEKLHLRFQLEHFELDIHQFPGLKNLSTISELCQELVKTRKAEIYPLVDRLVRLVLTLPISTASGERAFSAMKLVKTRLRNKMEDDFLTSYLITYIEKEIAQSFDTDTIIDEFCDMKERRLQFKLPK